MTEKKTEETPKEDAKKASDFGVSEVQDAFAKAQEVGHFGERVDPFDDHEHSLQSGPDSPTAVETAKALGEVS